MRVIWTRAALDDLDHILAYTAEHYPSVVAALEPSSPHDALRAHHARPYLTPAAQDSA